MNVVDPLQAIVSLAVLNFLESGTKVSVRNYQLVIDEANMYQGLVRWWCKDTRESLHSLFNAIRRFNIWEEMYSLPEGFAELLRKNAAEGVEKLQETYLRNDNYTEANKDKYVVDMLGMYKKMIANKSAENGFNQSQEKDMSEIDRVFCAVTKIPQKNEKDLLYVLFKTIMSSNENSEKKVFVQALETARKPSQIRVNNWITKNMVTI